MKRTVVLDAGHGNNTSGKRSPVWNDGSRLFEWEFNRDIVQRIANLLSQHSIPHHILTPEKYDIPLSYRCQRANALWAQDKSSYLISIHANAGGGSGWECYTSPGYTQSDEFAKEFYHQAAYAFQDVCPIRTIQGVTKLDDLLAMSDPDKEANFYILTKTQCPAILTENLFMDTYADCKVIMSNEGRDLIAKLHVDAILNIQNTL